MGKCIPGSKKHEGFSDFLVGWEVFLLDFREKLDIW